MAENKTKPTDADVRAFIDAVENDRRRQDSLVLLEMMDRITGFKPQMWGDSIVGYGRYRYKYKSGHGDEFFLTGFSPRKQALSIYIVSGFNTNPELMEKLGKYKTGKSCLYIKSLSDVDEKVLKRLIERSVQYMRKNYETK